MVTIVEAKPMHISGVGEESFLNRKRNGLFGIFGKTLMY
jgi:hypothetical protein